MGKNNYSVEAKKISCDSICEAMLLLLKTKQFADISITEIAKKAGVSRNAVYRNFETKEQIVVHLLGEITDRFKYEVKQLNFDNYRSYLIALFTHLQKYSPTVKILDCAGLGYLIRKEFMDWSTYPSGGIAFENFARVYRNSALFEVYMYWIKTGEKQAPDELTDIILNIIKNMNESIL